MPLLGYNHWKNYEERIKRIKECENFVNMFLFGGNSNLEAGPEKSVSEKGNTYHFVNDGSWFKYQDYNGENYLVERLFKEKSGKISRATLIVDKKTQKIRQAVVDIDTYANGAHSFWSFYVRDKNMESHLLNPQAGIQSIDARHSNGVHEIATYQEGKLLRVALSVSLADGNCVCGVINDKNEVTNLYQKDAQGKKTEMTVPQGLTADQLYKQLEGIKREQKKQSYKGNLATKKPAAVQTFAPQQNRESVLKNVTAGLRNGLLELECGMNGIISLPNVHTNVSSLKMLHNGLKQYYEGLREVEALCKERKLSPQELSAVKKDLEETRNKLHGHLNQIQESLKGVKNLQAWIQTVEVEYEKVLDTLNTKLSPVATQKQPQMLSARLGVNFSFGEPQQKQRKNIQPRAQSPIPISFTDGNISFGKPPVPTQTGRGIPYLKNYFATQVASANRRSASQGS